MNYLHHRNPPIVHRDLKSSNVLVDKNWTVKVKCALNDSSALSIYKQLLSSHWILYSGWRLWAVEVEELNLYNCKIWERNSNAQYSLFFFFLVFLMLVLGIRMMTFSRLTSWTCLFCLLYSFNAASVDGPWNPSKWTFKWKVIYRNWVSKSLFLLHFGLGMEGHIDSRLKCSLKCSNDKDADWIMIFFLLSFYADLMCSVLVSSCGN